MKLEEIRFERPAELAAREPPEARGTARDDVRLLVSDGAGHHHHRFGELVKLLGPGDLLVVNRSATVPASLPASGEGGALVLNLATSFGHGLWLAEPRRSASEPGCDPLRAGQNLAIGPYSVRLVAPHPGLPRLWFIHSDGDLGEAMARFGPARSATGTSGRIVRSRTTRPCSPRCPGASRCPRPPGPSPPACFAVSRSGASGWSACCSTAPSPASRWRARWWRPSRCSPSRSWSPKSTARAVNEARARGHRVIAVGTTVIRALESAWNGCVLQAHSGYTRSSVHPGNGPSARSTASSPGSMTPPRATWPSSTRWPVRSPGPAKPTRSPSGRGTSGTSSGIATCSGPTETLRFARGGSRSLTDPSIGRTLPGLSGLAVPAPGGAGPLPRGRLGCDLGRGRGPDDYRRRIKRFLVEPPYNRNAYIPLRLVPGPPGNP